MHVSGVDKCYEAIQSRVRRNEKGGVVGDVLFYVALFYPDGFSGKGIWEPDTRQ